MGKRGPLAGTAKRLAPTGIRFEPELKEQLEESAKLAGRSLAEEVSARLKASYSAIEFGNPETRRLAIAFALALEIESEQTGFAWFQNAWAWARAKASIDAICSLLKPAGDPDVVPDDAAVLRHLRAIGVAALVPEAAEQLKDTSLGELSGKAAVALLEAVADGAAAPSLDHLKETAAAVRDMLQAFDNDTVALNELRSAAGRMGSGKLLRKVLIDRKAPTRPVKKGLPI